MAGNTMTSICARHGVQRIQRYNRATGARDGTRCAPCAAERTARRRNSAPDVVLDSKLWSYYRIRLDDFRRMVSEQEGCCKACGQEPGADARGYDGTGLVVDHDHACCPATSGQRGGVICGKCVRGLLCQQCNIALGLLGDNPDRLHALLDYLDAA